jgi:hypothetical protein
MVRQTRRTSESKAFRRALGIRLRAASLQSTMQSCCAGVSTCHPNCRKVLNQTSLLTTQDMIKWSMDSVSWPQRAQRPLLSKPWLCRRSAVQSRSWITNQRKNLNSLELWLFRFSWRPSVQAQEKSWVCRARGVGTTGRPSPCNRVWDFWLESYHLETFPQLKILHQDWDG